MTTSIFWRQLDILEIKSIQPITIIGCGSTGSMIGLVLIKMGVKSIVLYDHDKIQEHNIPNQLFPLSEVGNNKTESLKKILKQFAPQPIKVNTMPIKFDGKTSTPIVICAIDSIKEREKIWNKYIKLKISIKTFIDARMGGEIMKIFAINPIDPDHIKFYEKTFDKAIPLPCTARSIIYNVFVLAGIIGNLTKRAFQGETIPRETMLNLVKYELYSK